jgi:hypothetical protein
VINRKSLFYIIITFKHFLFMSIILIKIIQIVYAAIYNIIKHTIHVGFVIIDYSQPIKGYYIFTPYNIATSSTQHIYVTFCGYFIKLI